MHRIEVLYPLTKGGTFLWCWILSIKVPRMEDFLHQERSCVQKSNFPKFLSKSTSDCFEMQTSPKAGSKVVTRYHGNPGTLTGLGLSEPPWEAPWGHLHKSREPRVSCLNLGKTSRDLLQNFCLFFKSAQFHLIGFGTLCVLKMLFLEAYFTPFFIPGYTNAAWGFCSVSSM